MIEDLVKAILDGGTFKGKNIEQMTYDDMIECAAFMIREGYTKSCETDIKVRTSLGFGPRA